MELKTEILNNFNFRSPWLGDSQLLAHWSALRGIFWTFCCCRLRYLHNFPDVSLNQVNVTGVNLARNAPSWPRHHAFKYQVLGFVFRSLFQTWILFLRLTNVQYFNCQNYFKSAATARAELQQLWIAAEQCKPPTFWKSACSLGWVGCNEISQGPLLICKR